MTNPAFSPIQLQKTIIFHLPSIIFAVKITYVHIAVVSAGSTGGGGNGYLCPGCHNYGAPLKAALRF